MADPLPEPEPVLEPDVSHVVTDDGEPVDGLFSERQMRLLVACLYDSWKPGRDFLAFANVGLFFHPNEPPLVPDVLVSLDVKPHEDLSEKKNQSYFVWRYGKPPDVVVEVVSNRVGGELEKAEKYARLGVGWYVLYDPERHLRGRALRAYELHGRHFVELADPSRLGDLGLGLKLWEGEYEGVFDTWIRWCDADHVLLPTGAEQAEIERQRADAERQRGDRLEARLRELGGG